MTDLHAFVAGPWGAALAILAMSIATFLCRIAGAVLMSRVTLTGRMERGLRALPGSIVVATIVPATLDGGVPAITSLAVAMAATIWTRRELIGLAAGLGTLSLIRTLGL